MTESDRPPLARINTSNNHFAADAEVTGDGRATIRFLDFKAKTFPKLARHEAKRLGGFNGNFPCGEHLTRKNKNYKKQYGDVLEKFCGIPSINIAIHIVGSRGDVQPFIPIAQILSKPPYSHRVRLCTHPVFKDFVEENGVEFFSIGGDPANLMAYMVKNPGLMPGMESLKAGEVGKRRAEIQEILEGCWRSCIEPGNGMGSEIKHVAERGSPEETDKLFLAEAIIANPPSYAHIHCAEKLGIPLHLMFTMPWSPTQSFPHPLASLEREDTDPSFANYISYAMMELLAWQGLSDIINRFCIRTLNLDPLSPLWGHMLLSRMKVPFTYAWSSALIPKPPDWRDHINITGFSFLSQSSYKPPVDLSAFLAAGPPPVYIGFGSIVVDNPDELTMMIFGAVKRAGVRALVSKGWGGLGGDEPPEGIFLLGNCPHDYLFKHVSCVVHHGGAGTTAIGIALGVPTFIIPFFGDQPFWGAMVHRAGAGPEPVPFKKLTEKSLADSITAALSPDVRTAVKEMSERIRSESGSEDSVKSFHDAVNFDSMRCLVKPDKVAVWSIKGSKVRLSLKAAAVLIDEGHINIPHLRLIKHRDWYVDEGPSDPVLAAVGVMSGLTTRVALSLVEYSQSMSNTVRRGPTPKILESTSADTSLDLTQTQTWEFKPGPNAVQNATRFPPERLEALAYQLVAKKYPYGMDNTPKRLNTFLPVRKSTTHRSTTSKPEKEEHSRAYDAAHDTGTFASGIALTLVKGPVYMLYSLANGFHNAPSFLLNDETVRRRDNITGVGSGVKVAGKEFTLGIFDGVTGLVTQPFNGARKDGFGGFAAGIGRGVGGLVFKTGAAVFGLPGYTLKGVEKQIQKRKQRDLKARILTIRLRQAVLEFERTTREEKNEIIKRWKELNVTLPK
ncbi:hypothetical protein BGZ60DRAFT_363549 [Tricladium varicosporioides]|nr:hypothetical protein BGZ60DRAFT_363549 [Hymenoscyphus varicosporioides]